MPRVAKIEKVLKALKVLGFEMLRQKGSHMFFQHPDGRTTLVPNHPEIGIRLLNKILKDTKTEKEEFFKLLE